MHHHRHHHEVHPQQPPVKSRRLAHHRDHLKRHIDRPAPRRQDLRPSLFPQQAIGSVKRNAAYATAPAASSIIRVFWRSSAASTKICGYLEAGLRCRCSTSETARACRSLCTSVSTAVAASNTASPLQASTAATILMARLTIRTNKRGSTATSDYKHNPAPSARRECRTARVRENGPPPSLSGHNAAAPQKGSHPANERRPAHGYWKHTISLEAHPALDARGSCNRHPTLLTHKVKGNPNSVNSVNSV